jgi:hypothetical protein
MKKSYYLLAFITVFLVLGFNHIKTQENDKTGIPYINLNYLKYLEDSLPCECEESVKTDFFVILDTNNVSHINEDEEEINYYGIYTIQAYTEEFYTQNIIKITPNFYKIGGDDFSKTERGSIILKNDTLYYDNHNIKSILIRNG